VATLSHSTRLVKGHRSPAVATAADPLAGDFPDPTFENNTVAVNIPPNIDPNSSRAKRPLNRGCWASRTRTGDVLGAITDEGSKTPRREAVEPCTARRSQSSLDTVVGISTTSDVR